MKTVTTLLPTFVLSALLFFISTLAIAAVPASFVYTSGQQFMMDGNPYYFQGNNIYYASIVDGATTDQNIVDMMYNASQKGVKVMRIWGFSDGVWGGTTPIQSAIGVWNGQSNIVALKKLDYAISQAQLRGMKVILPLVNSWKEYGGMVWYVHQILGASHTKVEFFTNAACQAAYKNYVNMILNRTNYYTNVTYKNDPTILSWELANEPNSYDEQLPNYGDNWDPSGTKIKAWLTIMADYVHFLDPNHMISTGEEGYKTGGSDWTDNGSKSLDFAGNTAIGNISFATIHVYPDAWSKSPAQINAFMADRASIAHALGKPIILEEFGSKAIGSMPTPGNKYDRDSILTEFINTARYNNFAGAMVWQMADIIRDVDFDFLFSSSTGTVIRNNAVYMNSKKYDFENSVNGWTKVPSVGGLYSTTEWAYLGGYSLKAYFALSTGAKLSLKNAVVDNYTGKTKVQAVVKNAPWGNQGAGMTAKLYIKAGPFYAWHDGGSIAINSNSAGTTLTLNLSGIEYLDQIREIGVEYSAGTSSSGQTSVYVDNITVQ